LNSPLTDPGWEFGLNIWARITAFFGSSFRQVNGYALCAGRLKYDVKDGPKNKAIVIVILAKLLKNPCA